MADKKNQQISMAASAIAMRGVRLFLNASRAAAERRASPPRARKTKPVTPASKLQLAVLEVLLKATKFNKPALRHNVYGNCVSVYILAVGLVSSAEVVDTRTDMPYRQLKEKTLEMLYRATHFTKNELEALFTMYRRLVTSAQNAAPATVIGQPAAKVDGIDQNTFRDVMHNTFDLVTEDIVLDRVWLTWERGANGGEGALKFESWARGLSILLRGTDEERRTHCFNVYDLNADGYITRDEMFVLLKNSLLKQPGDEDPDEGVRDLVELVLRKMDIDKDGKLSMDDYRSAVQQEPLLLEAFGQCLPTRRHAAAFLKTLVNKQ